MDPGLHFDKQADVHNPGYQTPLTANLYVWGTYFQFIKTVVDIIQPLFKLLMGSENQTVHLSLFSLFMSVKFCVRLGPILMISDCLDQ